MGRVVRPHGLRGQVVVELWTNRAERMAPGAVLRAGERSVTISRGSRMHGSGGRERWLVSFEGVGDREGAESLRGEVLRAAPMDVDGALWVHEVVGSKVHDESGDEIGVVAEVEANPASDLLVLANGHLIPMHFIVAEEPGRLTVRIPPGLLDL